MPRLDPITPELVLVAPPEEAQRAREQLDETPAAQDAAVGGVTDPAADDDGWGDLLARMRTESPLPEAEKPERQPQPPKLRRWRRPAVGVAVLAVAVFVGVAWARHNSDQPRLAGPTAASPPPATTPVLPKPVKPPPVHVKPKTPTFVPARVWSWPRVRGSTRYRVQFFRNGRKVLDVRTAKARLALPKSFAFHKGRYRWTVVPIAAGKPKRPIVDSTFVVAKG